MAEKLSEFPAHRRGVRTSQYPWDEWFDGSVWKLTEGEDFTCKPESLRSSATAAAAAQGLALKTSVDPDDNAVILQMTGKADPNKKRKKEEKAEEEAGTTASSGEFATSDGVDF